MLNNFNSQFKSKTVVRPPKKTKLSLNLHIMPQTITSHWKKWLVLGLVILVVFIIVSLVFYSFMT